MFLYLHVVSAVLCSLFSSILVWLVGEIWGTLLLWSAEGFIHLHKRIVSVLCLFTEQMHFTIHIHSFVQLPTWKTAVVGHYPSF